MSRKRDRNSIEQNGSKLQNSDGKRRKYTGHDMELAQIYDHLSSDDKRTRIAAAMSIVKRCDTLGPNMVTTNAIGERANPSAENLALNFIELRKMYARLIRGLCSNRKSARSGFSGALTEVLRLTLDPQRLQIQDSLEEKVKEFVEMIKKYTQPEGSVSGQEKRDHLLGRICGYNAVVESEVLFQSKEAGPAITLVLDALCQLTWETPWLRDQFCSIICRAVRILASKKADASYPQRILQVISTQGLSKTPESVAIWLELLSNSPNISLLKGEWFHDDPLSGKEIPSIAKIMTQSQSLQFEQDLDFSQRKALGSRQITPGFAWDVIVSHLIGEAMNKSSEPAKKPRRATFDQFWTEVVDNNFFAVSASSERKSVGFQIFAKVVNTAPGSMLKAAFSSKLMKCLINQSANSDRYLHNTAESLLSSIIARAKADPTAATIILSSLTSDNGTINFDTLTRSTTVQTILMSADDCVLEDMVHYYCDLIDRPSTQDQKVADSQRQIIADELVALMAYRTVKISDPKSPESAWLLLIVRTFTTNGYTDLGRKERTTRRAKPPISSTSQDMFKSRLSSCLTRILSTQSDKEAIVPFYVVSKIGAFERNGIDALKLGATVRVTTDRARMTLSRIDLQTDEHDKGNRDMLHAFKLLISMTLLQVYNGEADAITLLDDLNDCYKSIFDDHGTKDHVFHVMIEIILSFASKPSMLCRILAEQIFSTFASKVSTEAFQSIFEILKQSEGLSGQQALFDDNADHDGQADEMDLGEETSASASDGSANEDSNGQSRDGESSQSSQDEDDESLEGEALSEELIKLDNALATALGTTKHNNPLTAAGDHNAEDPPDSSSDSDMDDDQMIALDPHLTAIFRDRKATTSTSTSKKQDKKDAKQTVINFKNRVLDLLSIYIKKQHANPLAFDIILPLLQLMRNTRSRQISEKTFKLLESYLKAAKKSKSTLQDQECIGPPHDGVRSSESIDTNKIMQKLNDIHAEALLFASTAHSRACSKSSLFLARVLLGSDPSHHPKVAALYAATEKKRLGTKSQLPNTFFDAWHEWSCDWVRRRSHPP